MINFLLNGTFYDCCGNDHNLTDFHKTSIGVDSEDHVISIGVNSDGCYEVKLQNAHFGDLKTGFDIWGDRITTSNPAISIIPDDASKPITVNLTSNGEYVQSFSILPQDFEFTSIIPDGYGIESWDEYVNNFGHQLLVMTPYLNNN